MRTPSRLRSRRTASFDSESTGRLRSHSEVVLNPAATASSAVHLIHTSCQTADEHCTDATLAQVAGEPGSGLSP
jgi:hypothetical protein